MKNAFNTKYVLISVCAGLFLGGTMHQVLFPKVHADYYSSDGARLEKLIQLQHVTNGILKDISDNTKRR